MASKKPFEMLDTQDQSDIEQTFVTGESEYNTQANPSSGGGLGGLVGKIFRLPWVGSDASEHSRGRELRRAVRAENISLVKKMLKEGVGVNESQEASLACIATRRCNLELLKILLDAKVDANEGDRRNRSSRLRTPLHEASRKGWQQGIKLLLDAKVEVDKPDDSGATALFLSVRSGHFAASKILLEAGANPSGSPAGRLAPIHEASTPEMLELLLSYGVDINQTDKSGSTALHHQSKAGRLRMVEALLARNASLQAIDERGRNALFFIGGKGQAKEVLDLLLKKGIDTSTRDVEANTFVHLVVLRCVNPETLDWLYLRENNLWLIPNHQGETALDVLKTRNFLSLAQKIEKEKKPDVQKSGESKLPRSTFFES